MTDAELRAGMIESGSVRPLEVRSTVFRTDHVGRRSAARDILLEEEPHVAAVVVDNPWADPAVRDMLRRWLGRREERAA